MKTVKTNTGRIPFLDFLRGVALLGILLIHCVQQFNVLYPTSYEGLFGDFFSGQFEATLNFLIAGKFILIFSLLFGISFGLQAKMKREYDSPLFFYSKNLVLFVFGFAHLMIYSGDILSKYAIMAVVLYLLVKGLKPIYIKILFLVFFFQLIPAALLLVQGDLFKQELVDQRIRGPIYQFSGLSEVIYYNMETSWLQAFTKKMLSPRMHRIFAFFLLGYLITTYDLRRLLKRSENWSKHVFVVLSVAVGLLYWMKFYMGGLGIEGIFKNSFSSNGFMTFALTHLWKWFILLVITSFWICSVLLLHQSTDPRSWFIKMFSNVGKMSLTNYLLQSILCVIIFYGFGFGLYALGLEWRLLLGMIVFLMLAFYSTYSLDRYNYGPFEELWKNLSKWVYSLHALPSSVIPLGVKKYLKRKL
ncbi:DUF418 domain-containing protein [Aureicoccus marinus]|uniref:DUF418 domain-containing protein n=1 Tax=Aureicoccus marinus TaxID=754435 RepID=A0A2S7T3S6_9FLAO|nr:DUF418 domain-containing protein [Aureicoccus marinus]PQJ14570.1 hypothetical protein BST99_01335 [Aureicoccus marinus]